MLPERFGRHLKSISGRFVRAVGPFWAHSWIPRSSQHRRMNYPSALLGPNWSLGTSLKNAIKPNFDHQNWSQERVKSRPRRTATHVFVHFRAYAKINAKSVSNRRCQKTPKMCPEDGDRPWRKLVAASTPAPLRFQSIRLVAFTLSFKVIFD